MVAHCDDEQKPPFGHLQAGVSPEEAQAFMQHKQRAADIATADTLLECIVVASSNPPGFHFDWKEMTEAIADALQKAREKGVQ